MSQGGLRHPDGEAPEPASPPPANSSLLLIAPFAYFFHSRVPRPRQKIGWALGYVLPVLGLAASASGGATGLLLAALMMTAVYTAYEFGYLVNDTLSIEREERPTLRLTRSTREALRRRLALALAARLTIGGGLVALLLPIHGSAAEAALLGWATLWPLFAVYNRWRGPITIALHFLLVGLRYLLPIVAAAPTLEPAAMAPLLLLYALPNTFEAAWKPRYGMTALRDLAGGTHRFRLAWAAAMTAAGLAFVWVRPSEAAWTFLCASLYYLLFRGGASLLPRSPPVVSPPTHPALPPE